MNDDIPQASRRGLVLSDLHLFARRSRGQACFESLRMDLKSVDILVLNGDTFDFRWSFLPDHEATRAAALGWLRKLGHDFPWCQVHYVLGNHDCLQSFVDSLGPLQAALPQFQWHEHAICIGSHLFLHGDCACGTMNMPGLHRYRASWRQDCQRGARSAAFYESLDWFGITPWIHRCYFPRRRTVRRIACYLDRAHPGWRWHIRACYFGHTHLPLIKYAHDGVLFFNSGSAIHNMKFQPIFFDVPSTAPINSLAATPQKI